MHLLLAPLTVRWMSLITGAAHATTALRALSRHVPEPETESQARPRSTPPLNPPRRRSKAARPRPSSAA